MKLFGIIGFPLSHSFSCKYFEGKFKEAALDDYKYVAFPLQDLKLLPELLKQKKNLLGFNVTIPYKEKIISYLDYIDPAAKEIGAVNTVKVFNNKLYGYNTDYLGFRKAYLRNDSIFRKAIILGNGGAAKAVKYVFELLNIESMVVSRTPQKDKNEIHYSDLDKYLIDNSIIINTTPLGMYPDVESFPLIPYELINSTYYVIDLIYNPKKTIFIKKTEKQGAKVKNGYEMLIIQANESWRIWM